MFRNLSWNKFYLIRRFAPSRMANYETWTREDLIARLNQLEPGTPKPKSKAPEKIPNKPFDFSSHPTRKIAVKFCYSGWEYNGLAFQDLPTPLPTVEGVLFDAFAKTRLVDPYSRIHLEA